MSIKWFILASAILFTSMSCIDERTPRIQPVDRNDMASILAVCKGHAVVKAKGYNAGNMDSYKHYLIVCDDSLNCYEYCGAKYNVKVGDTLK